MWPVLLIQTAGGVFNHFYNLTIHNKLKPQWLLSAHTASEKLCVCVTLTDRKKKKLKQQAASVSFRLGRQSVLCYSSPPRLSSRPSFSTQQPPEQSLHSHPDSSPPSSSSLLSRSALPSHSPCLHQRSFSSLQWSDLLSIHSVAASSWDRLQQTPSMRRQMLLGSPLEIRFTLLFAFSCFSKKTATTAGKGKHQCSTIN